MPWSTLCISFLLVCGLHLKSVHAATVHLTVTDEVGASVSPHLYGISLEDVDQEGDGALYGQLLYDPGFISGYKNTIGGTINDSATTRVDKKTPLTSAIQHSMKFTVNSDATGETGLSGRTIYSFDLADHYTGSFYIRGHFDGDMSMEIYEPTKHPGKGLAKRKWGVTKVHVKSVANEWTKVEYDINTTSTDSIVFAEWRLVFDAHLLAGRTIRFAYPTLYAPTFKDRPIGMNKRHTQIIQRLQPKYARFPGGKNLLGFSAEARWKWNETIGPLIQRPGRIGIYGYVNSDGQGLLEYLQYCEDLNIIPVLSIWAGAHVLQTFPNPPALVGPALQPYVDDALAELEFIMGDSDTPGGQLRAQYGHPAPFPLQYVEIGFHDDQYGCKSYPRRLLQFYNAIKRKYPSLTIIASTTKTTCLPDQLPEGMMLDYYIDENFIRGPSDLKNASRDFKNFDAANPIMVGDFAIGEEIGDSVSYYSSVQSAASEAVFMMAWEKNPEVVKMGAYRSLISQASAPDESPALYVVNGGGPQTDIFAVSFYLQSLYSNNTGSNVVKVNSADQEDPVFWSATVRTSGGSSRYFLKLANFQERSDVTVNIRIPTVGGNACVWTNLHGPPHWGNGFPPRITPNRSRITPANGVYSIIMSPYESGVFVCST